MSKRMWSLVAALCMGSLFGGCGLLDGNARIVTAILNELIAG